MTYMAVVRSPYAHARIRSVGESGVAAPLTPSRVWGAIQAAKKGGR